MHPQYSPQQRKKPVSPWVWIGLILVIIAVAWAGCAALVGRQSEPSRAAAPAATTSTRVTAAFPITTSATVATSRASAPVACETAPSGVVGFLNAALSDGGYSLALAQQVTRPANGDQYIGGDIMRGETRVSSSDVWLIREGVPYALSSDARKLSGLVDGRRLPGPKPTTLLGPSAGDEWGSGVQECVNAARRAGR